MSASSQSYPQGYSTTAIPIARLTITEVEIEPSPVLGPVLGKSRIYLFAGAGTALGVLIGLTVAISLSLPVRLARAAVATAAASPMLLPESHGQLAAPGTEAASFSSGARDFGSADAIAAGLNGRLTTGWQDGAKFHLTVEPAGAFQRAGFAMAVTSSPRPLSVGFELLDSAGAVLCGQDVVLRYNAARATPGTAGSVQQLEAQELAREHRHPVFENMIDGEGQIAAIDAQGSLPCSEQGYRSAASWSLTADFPSAAEQGELVKGAAAATVAEKTTSSHRHHS